MDSSRRSSFLPSFNLFVLAILLLRFPVGVHGAGVLKVKRKFGANTPIADLMRHDELRHARRLSARPVDVHLGGSINIGMWYADIAIGTPPRHLQVHVDTGSPITWVDCEGCVNCVKSNGTVKLETYNPKLSKTARIVTGDERLCYEMSMGMPKNSSSDSLQALRSDAAESAQETKEQAAGFLQQAGAQVKHMAESAVETVKSTLGVGDHNSSSRS